MYRFDSNDSNQEGAGAVIMSKSRDKLKTYLNYQSVYGHQLDRMVNYFDALLSIKSHDSLITWFYKITL